MQQSRMFPYLAGAALVAAVLIAIGAPLASLRRNTCRRRATGSAFFI